MFKTYSSDYDLFDYDDCNQVVLTSSCCNMFKYEF